ncbi:MAG: 1-deoxy-D-xylulose-5-phosphate reductoisomerase, partial [Armatimonadota bacterium]|nr:1-deoxy-D-xylulose-5-phosphate reductoisomerase [Armatimonadota bacterium]
MNQQPTASNQTSTAPRTISILGSTGSIGRQALQVVEQHPDRLRVAALAAGRNVALLAEQAARFRPRLVAIADPRLENELRILVEPLGCRVVSGPAGLVEAGTIEEADLVLAGMVGAAGILPTLAAVDAGKDVAIANKEVLVAAGAIVRARAALSGAFLLPVDSEHSAIFQAMQGSPPGSVERVVLTGSGGPFRGKRRADLAAVTVEQALCHPTWRMGRKITIDSATLFNKGLEVMEAASLYGVPVSRVGVLVHPQSIVHALVRFRDGSLKAQLGPTDM